MSDDNSALIAAGGTVGGSVLTFLGLWLKSWFDRKDTLERTVDAKLKTLMEGYEKRIEDLTKQGMTLTDQVAAQDVHIGVLTRHILMLTKRLTNAGFVVPPIPSLDDISKEYEAFGGQLDPVE